MRNGSQPHQMKQYKGLFWARYANRYVEQKIDFGVFRNHNGFAKERKEGRE